MTENEDARQLLMIAFLGVLALCRSLWRFFLSFFVEQQDDQIRIWLLRGSENCRTKILDFYLDIMKSKLRKVENGVLFGMKEWNKGRESESEREIEKRPKEDEDDEEHFMKASLPIL